MVGPGACNQTKISRMGIRDRGMQGQVAQKDAELERLRQQVRVPRQPNPTPKPAVATASRRDSEESDSSPRPEQYLMAGRYVRNLLPSTFPSIPSEQLGSIQQSSQRDPEKPQG